MEPPNKPAKRRKPSRYDPRYRKQLRVDNARGVKRFVPAEPVRAHVVALMTAGLTMTAVSAASGVPLATVQGIYTGERRAVRPRTSTALLKLTHASVIRSATGFVPIVGTRRRVQALMAIGWTLDGLSERIGVDARGVVAGRRSLTSKDVHVAVCRVYDELWATPGPSAIGRAKAASYGYLPPMAWDDDEIDNPAAEPTTGATGSGGISLAEVVEMLNARDTLETVARRLGVDEESIITAARRKGTPEQAARVRLASEEMRDIRLGLAS